VHRTFILGLPGETKETIEETIRFAREVNPHTIQVSIAAPYPGTELYRQAIEAGWLRDDDDGGTLVSERGTQLAALSYPHLGHTEILSTSRRCSQAASYSPAATMSRSWPSTS
jgi:radical SAM superfamily enzyme YgiQ (UPF0313 family)